MELIDIQKDPDDVFELLESIGRGAFSFVHRVRVYSRTRLIPTGRQN